MIDAPPTTNPDDPLSQPTRARLFALLGDLGRPADTAELAQQLGLHPNGVRIHLERLDVLPTEVVNAADGWLVADPAVWPARVVVLEPVWQGACAVV